MTDRMRDSHVSIAPLRIAVGFYSAKALITKLTVASVGGFVPLAVRASAGPRSSDHRAIPRGQANQWSFPQLHGEIQRRPSLEIGDQRIGPRDPQVVGQLEIAGQRGKPEGRPPHRVAGVHAGPPYDQQLHRSVVAG